MFPAPQEVLCVIGCNEDERVRPQPLIVTVRSRAKSNIFSTKVLNTMSVVPCPLDSGVSSTT